MNESQTWLMGQLTGHPISGMGKSVSRWFLGFLKIPRFQLVKKWRQNKDSVSDFMLKTWWHAKSINLNMFTYFLHICSHYLGEYGSKHLLILSSFGFWVPMVFAWKQAGVPYGRWSKGWTDGISWWWWFHSLILLHWGRDHHADNYVR